MKQYNRMTMKKIIYMLLIASCGWSCDSFLDVNPKAEVIDEDMFSTASGVEDALYGVYSALSCTVMELSSLMVTSIWSQ